MDQSATRPPLIFRLVPASPYISRPLDLPEPTIRTPDALDKVATTMAAPRLDWYQTESDVTLTLLRKGVVKEAASVDFGPDVAIRLPDYERVIRVAHPIVFDQCSWRVTPTKVEIRLRKAECIRWAELERKEEAAEDRTAHTYPTSSTKGPKNWDRMEKEAEAAEKEEKLDGDAAVNKLFQDIYKDASDETKKAMMKSFQESKGTCLSTNWEEVKKETVECKPPEGMEFKKY